MNRYLDKFMATFPFEGLTYDDVTLVTQYADFLPDDASLETKLTSRQKMKIPFMSAAMDTVTEAPMAIAMAIAGGIGVIHKNLEEDDQAKEVAKVKNYLNGLISKPICFHANDDISFLRAEKRSHGYKFNGFPVLDDQDRLVGMITGSDMRFAPLNAAKLAEVMQKDPITAKPGTSLKKAYEIMRANKIGKLPLVDRNGRVVGLYSFTDVQRLVENQNPTYNCDEQFRLRVSASVSGGKGDLSRMEKLAAAGVDVVVVDSAHGHSKGIIEMTKYIVKHFPKVDVIAGNIATGEAAVALAKCGAHAVKVGIGPGSICTTRVVCGVGIPQLTAVYSAAKALRERSKEPGFRAPVFTEVPFEVLPEDPEHPDPDRFYGFLFQDTDLPKFLFQKIEKLLPDITVMKNLCVHSHFLFPRFHRFFWPHMCSSLLSQNHLLYSGNSEH